MTISRNRSMTQVKVGNEIAGTVVEWFKSTATVLVPN
jgi:hypothetical protein